MRISPHSVADEGRRRQLRRVREGHHGTQCNRYTMRMSRKLVAGIFERLHLLV
jgi:hypothetical protein